MRGAHCVGPVEQYHELLCAGRHKNVQAIGTRLVFYNSKSIYKGRGVAAPPFSPLQIDVSTYNLSFDCHKPLKIPTIGPQMNPMDMQSRARHPQNRLQQPGKPQIPVPMIPQQMQQAQMARQQQQAQAQMMASMSREFEQKLQAAKSQPTQQIPPSVARQMSAPQIMRPPPQMAFIPRQPSLPLMNPMVQNPPPQMLHRHEQFYSNVVNKAPPQQEKEAQKDHVMSLRTPFLPFTPP